MIHLFSNKVNRMREKKMFSYSYNVITVVTILYCSPLAEVRGRSQGTNLFDIN